jgi:hypothetical protein
MSKKVSFGTKPNKPTQTKIDEWVENRPEGQAQPQPEQKQPIKTKRFTMDIPSDLHTRIKSQCALRGITMHDEVVALLEKHFPPQ